MKKILSLLFIAVMLFTGNISAHAVANEYNWYFKSAENHNQPIVFDNIKFPDKYGAIYMGSPDEKVIYLTFDAGYISDNVIKILDILKEQQVKSAFFILPVVVEKNTDIAKRMYQEGHIVANHSYSHKNMARITDRDTFLNELTRLEDLYFHHTGYKMSKYFRPPEGIFSEQNLAFCHEAGYIPTFWSFAYADWDNNNQKSAVWARKKVLDCVHNGMVMLLHPNSETNATILGDVISELKNDGYRFGTLDELVLYRDSKKSG